MYKDLVKGKDGFDYEYSGGDKNNSSYTLLKIIILLISLQIIRIVVKQTTFIFIKENNFNDCLISMTIMITLTLLIVYKSKKENISLNVFSYMKTKESKMYYILLTLLIFILIFTSPLITSDISIGTILPFIYSTIIIPVYEEIIFRSYIWGKLEGEYESNFKVYMVTTTLFALWHIGYIDSIAMVAGYSSLWFVVFIKCSVMLSYGLFIGYFRYKIKNSYSCMLIHSFINIFGG
ncbi:MAG: CPBP family intramembrane glutamic endopeptidase [Terrisporobacter sp.]|uniref:CPBP family intramembrane glutamic endopeptidase n=1 Tax=Terrisporobacter sp. TaxID=1965305 RepID=UPI002FC712EA